VKSGEPKLLKGLQAEYVPAIWRGKNTSGFRAFGKNLVVMVDECASTTSGGILLTEDMSERMTMVATTGCVVQCGPEAFRRFDDGTAWVGVKPEPGSRIYFEQYAGTLQRGIDGKNYRIMDYRCVSAEMDLDNPDVVASIAAFEADVARIEAEPREMNALELGAAAGALGEKPLVDIHMNRQQRRRQAARSA
jgi:co-chaperonin GroES (HSP10)